MVLFTVAHAVKLVDGRFAIRCPEFPGCEACHERIEPAREQFGAALLRRVQQMIAAGETPPLLSYEEVESCFAMRCRIGIEASDRQPGTLDQTIVVRVRLPPAAAERLELIRSGLLTELDLAGRLQRHGQQLVSLIER